MRLEINLTLRCQLSCQFCNRICNLTKNKEDYQQEVNIEQIDNLISDLKRTNTIITKCKVLGGQPTLNKDFVNIWNKIVSVPDLITFVKLETNHVDPLPIINLPKHTKIQGRSVGKKHHIPFPWSPKENGIIVKIGDCAQMKRCGYSLSGKGYLPCSQAIALCYLLDIDLYKKELPISWTQEELNLICQHCPENMDKKWKEQYCNRDIRSFTKEELQLSNLWQECFNNKSVKEY